MDRWTEYHQARPAESVDWAHLAQQWMAMNKHEESRQQNQPDFTMNGDLPWHSDGNDNREWNWSDNGGHNFDNQWRDGPPRGPPPQNFGGREEWRNNGPARPMFPSAASSSSNNDHHDTGGGYQASWGHPNDNHHQGGFHQRHPMPPPPPHAHNRPPWIPPGPPQPLDRIPALSQFSVPPPSHRQQWFPPPPMPIAPQQHAPPPAMNYMPPIYPVPDSSSSNYDDSPNADFVYTPHPPTPPFFQMDAAARKKLPAWILEGLEKAEKEKQKQLEKEEKLRIAEEEKAKRRAAAGKSKFDSSSEEEDNTDGEKGEEDSVPLWKKGDGDPIFGHRRVAEEEEEDEYSREERKIMFMNTVKSLMMKVLIDTTDGLLLDLAESSIKEREKTRNATPKLVAKSSALAAIATFGDDDDSDVSSGDESPNKTPTTPKSKWDEGSPKTPPPTSSSESNSDEAFKAPVGIPRKFSVKPDVSSHSSNLPIGGSSGAENSNNGKVEVKKEESKKENKGGDEPVAKKSKDSEHKSKKKRSRSRSREKTSRKRSRSRERKRSRSRERKRSRSRKRSRERRRSKSREKDRKRSKERKRSRSRERKSDSHKRR